MFPYTGVFNYYPPTAAKGREDNAVGLGSHTDLQLFTLLWQDHVGGLQVLNKDGQWIKVNKSSSLKGLRLIFSGTSYRRNNCREHRRLYDETLQRYLQVNGPPRVQPSYM